MGDRFLPIVSIPVLEPLLYHVVKKFSRFIIALWSCITTAAVCGVLKCMNKTAFIAFERVIVYFII